MNFKKYNINIDEDLQELCKERELFTTEPFPHNAFYGISRILKDYAQIDHKYSLKAVIPHGVIFNFTSYTNFEIYNNLPFIFCYPNYRKNIYRKKTNKFVISFASPYVYLNKMLEPLTRDNERKGLLFFPAHSTHHLEADMDHEKIANKLSNLDSEYHPISICIYWKDFLNGKHIAYEKRGFKIVSAGHIYDENFLIRLYFLLSNHKYASSNDIGSSLFYSVKSGCSFFFLEGGNILYKGNPDILSRDHPKKSIVISDYIYNKFSSPTEKITQDQIQIVDYFLNSKYLLSPLSLRNLFRISEKLFLLRIMSKKILNFSKK